MAVERKIGKDGKPYLLHTVVFGRDSVELKPGPHYAPYSAICPRCSKRYGKPASELNLEPCVKCARIIDDTPKRTKVSFS